MSNGSDKLKDQLAKIRARQQTNARNQRGETFEQFKARLPENLRQETPFFNLRGAFEGGLEPELADDGALHFGSRNPITGELLKRPGHPTFDKMIAGEEAAGFEVFKRGGRLFSRERVKQFVDPSRPSRRGDRLNLQLLRIKEAQIARTPETGADPRQADQIPLQERVERFERETPFMARFGARLVRGFKGLEQGFISSGAQTRASTLAQLEAIEEGRTVPFFTSGVRDPNRAGEMTNVAGFRKLSSKERKKRIVNLRGRVASDVSSIARLQREISDIPQNPAAEAVGAAETFEEAFEAFKVDPIGVVAQFGVESSVRSAPALALGAAGALAGGAIGAAAGTGFGSGFVESQAGIVEGLSRLGVDISDPEAIKEALQDEAISRDVRDFARARAVIVGGFDALSGGLASRTLAPRAISSPLARLAVNVPVQTAIQGAAGASGEAAAQVATTGEIQPGEIVAEALGEVFFAPAEVAALGAAARRPQDALQAKLDGLREAEPEQPVEVEVAPEQTQAPERALEVEPEQQAPVERAPEVEPAFGRSLEEDEIAAARESQDPQVQQAADLLTEELQKTFAEQNLETIESATQILRGGVPLIPVEGRPVQLDDEGTPGRIQTVEADGMLLALLRAEETPIAQAAIPFGAGEAPGRLGLVQAAIDTEAGTATIENVGLERPFRNRGLGLELYQELIAQAGERGLVVESGNLVSPDAAQIYAALERRGFTVERNEATIETDAGLFSPEGSVFRITQPKRTTDGPTQALPPADQPAIDAGRAPEARRAVEQEQITPEEAQAPTPEVPGRRTPQELLDEAAVSPRPEEANIEAQLEGARRELATARRRLAEEEARLLGLRAEGRQADVFTGAPEQAAPERDIFGEVPTPGRQDVERVLSPLQSDVRAQQANVLALESQAQQARQDIQRQLDIEQAPPAEAPALFTASDGRTEVRPGEVPGQIAVFNGQTGKRLDRRSRAFEPAVAEYFADQVENIDQGRRVTDEVPEIRLDQFPQLVAQESENPFEIIEAYVVERDVEQAQAAGISPVLEGVESAMQQGRISTESFDRFGDPNRRRDDRQITLNYLGGDIALDTLAEEITADTGIETTPGDLIEIIEEFPGGPGTFRARSRVLPDLAERFEELTGVRLTGSLVDQIVEQAFTPVETAESVSARAAVEEEFLFAGRAGGPRAPGPSVRQQVIARIGRLGRVSSTPEAEAEGIKTNAAVNRTHRSTTTTDVRERIDVPDFATDPGESAEGRKLIERIKRDKKGERVGMRSIVDFLNAQIGLELRVGPENTTLRHGAVYERARNLARSRSGVATHNFHEAGHGISALMELSSPALLQHPGLVELTQAEGSLASMETPEEGFAEWVRIFVMDPGRLETPAMAGLTAAVLDRLSEHCPKCLAALRDSARAVEAHLGRSVAAQFRSMNTDRPGLPGFVDQMREAIDRVLFTVGSRSWAIERTERKIWRAFRENLADRKEANRLARSFFRSVNDTPADLRQAYQSILRITAEVATAIIGTKKVKGMRVFTTGAGIQIDSQEAARLEVAGIPVADALKDVSQKHGQMVQLTDYSLQSVVEEVGSDNWADFENYAQALVSLERFREKGLVYPGWETVTPAKMAEIVQIYQNDHPEWIEQFRRLNRYADQMLVISVVGGLIDVDAAVAMKRAWEHYIPLLREPERGPTSRRASTAERVDPGFRRAKGSELPIMPLLEALEQRTRQVLDAYYTNRAMLAPVKMAEHAMLQQDLSFELRTLVGRVVTPLKGITVPVANLSKPEAKIVIAQFLNDQILTEKIERQTAGAPAPTAQELEALRAEGLDPSETVSPGDISLSWSGLDIWRSADPRGINIIAPKVNGEYQFFQVEDPILYDFFAKSADAGEVMDLLFNKILSRVVEPWKRLLTQNLPFAIRNAFARDPATAAFFGVSPESAPELVAREGAKTLLPGYFLAVGLMQQLTGRVPSAVVQGELLSRTYQTTTSAAHKARVSRFREVFEEGVVIDGYFQMPVVERLAALPGQVMSATLKIFELFLWRSGSRAFAQMTEEATRLGAYAAVKKAGLSDEAAQRAYDMVSGNFGERPASGGVYAVYRSAGFLNPGVQVAMEFVRRTTSPDPEIRWRAVAARLASISLFTAVGWAVNKMLTSDEREEELKERPDWDRLQYMPIGGYLRLPFDYGPIGAMQSFTWNMLDTAAGDGPRAKSMARILLQRVVDLPGHPTAFVNPQILTLLENQANFSFFYGEPIEPPYFDFLPPEQRVFYSTPGFYRWLGEMSGQSPVLIGNFVRNGLSAQIDGAIKIIDRLNSGRPMQDLADIPLFGRLIQRTPRAWGTRSVGEVVELDEKFRAVKVLYERAIEDPSSSQSTREELARRMNSLARSHQAMLAIQRQQDQIRLARDQGRFDLVPQLQQNMEEIAARALSDSGLFPAPQEPVP